MTTWPAGIYDDLCKEDERNEDNGSPPPSLRPKLKNIERQLSNLRRAYPDFEGELGEASRILARLRLRQSH